MKVKFNSIEFKSLTEHFIKEMNDIKPNTVRLITKEEQTTIEHIREKYLYMNVKIYEIGTERYLSRRIKDITYCAEIFGQVLIVISWIPENC